MSYAPPSTPNVNLTLGGTTYTPSAGDNVPLILGLTPDSISSISFVGLTPSMPTGLNGTATIGQIAFTGLIGTSTLGAFVAVAPQVVVSVTGLTGTHVHGFSATANMRTIGLVGLNPVECKAKITGLGFNCNAVITAGYGNVGDVSGDGFNCSPTILGGSAIQGFGLNCNPTITINAPEYAYAQGQGFDCFPAITIVSVANINVNGIGFNCAPIILGGTIVNGDGFDCLPVLSITVPVSIFIRGYGFDCIPAIGIDVPASIIVHGYGFDAMLWHGEVHGYGFDCMPFILSSQATSNSQAFVMNINTTVVSRWTNYPFDNIVSLGGKYYGVKSDGLYLLDGDLDISAKINGSITLKDTDFGVFQTKTLQYVYLNSDSEMTITPFVDGAQKPTQASRFGGRKTKLGLGNRGRYWQLKIEHIKKLEGIEALPNSLQRRVK